MRALALLMLLLLGLLPVPLGAAGLVDVNTATAEELLTVEGIGETTAEKIIEYRENSGPITDIATVCSLRGVGTDTETCKKIEAHITFASPASAAEQAEGSAEQTSSASKSAGTKSTKKGRVPVESIKVFVPEIAYVNQPVSFDVEPEDGRERLVRYAWNFGDGMTADLKSPEHMYKYPGTYVVFVKSRYMGEELTARGELTVLPVALSLTRTENGDVQLHNNAKYEIDLGGFTLSGEKSFTIPPHTILLSAATLTARRGLLETGSRGLVSVMDPAGTVIAAVLPNETPASMNVHAAARKQSFVPLEAAKPLDTDLEPLTDALPNPEEPMVYRPDNAAAAGKAQSFDYGSSLPYLGLTGLLLAGIIGVYAKRRI